MVDYLIKKIPRDIFEKVYEAIKKDGEHWYIAHHFGFGMSVRNLLRGKFDWRDDTTLDNSWQILVEEAVNKLFES